MDGQFITAACAHDFHQEGSHTVLPGSTNFSLGLSISRFSALKNSDQVFGLETDHELIIGAGALRVRPPCLLWPFH